MTSKDKLLTVEVAYAEPDKQKIVVLDVEPGTSARQAVMRSGIENDFPHLTDLGAMPLGLFGQSLGTKGLDPAETYVLNEGDRIEIYRPLVSDPKEVRRRRAEKAKLASQESAADKTESGALKT